MKTLIASLALLTAVGISKADVTVLFPDGDFDHPAGAPGAWFETGGGTTWSYPTTGGNPNGYGVMDGTGGWGIWVGGNTTPLPIGPMGLVAGNTYTFVQDMIEIAAGDGVHPPGIKIESWGPAGKISDSGDMTTPVTSSWQTYSFPYTISPGATGLKVVPLWSSGGKVGYDNIGVIVTPTPLTVSISSPADGDTVSTNFAIAASAVVSPGSVTNVYFFDGATLLGNSAAYPYGFTNSSGITTLGAHTFTVVARDSGGNWATSSPPVHVTVAGISPPAPNYPTNNAPTPIWPAANVVNIYASSGVYPQLSPCNWYPWGAGGSRGDFTIPGGNVVKSYLALQYAGVEVNPSYNLSTALDVSKMTTFHVDIWTTADQMAIKLVSATFNGAAPELIYDEAGGVITSNHWISLDIPLSVFTNINPALNLSKIDQLLWIDNGDIAGPGIQNGDFYVDNVFFYNNTPVIQAPALNGTTFSCNVPSQTGITYVLEATSTLVPSAWTAVQTNAGNGGMLNFTVPVNPAAAKQYFRINSH